MYCCLFSQSTLNSPTHSQIHTLSPRIVLPPKPPEMVSTPTAHWQRITWRLGTAGRAPYLQVEGTGWQLPGYRAEIPLEII